MGLRHASLPSAATSAAPRLRRYVPVAMAMAGLNTGVPVHVSGTTPTLQRRPRFGRSVPIAQSSSVRAVMLRVASPAPAGRAIGVQSRDAAGARPRNSHYGGRPRRCGQQARARQPVVRTPRRPPWPEPREAGTSARAPCASCRCEARLSEAERCHQRLVNHCRALGLCAEPARRPASRDSRTTRTGRAYLSRSRASPKSNESRRPVARPSRRPTPACPDGGNGSLVVEPRLPVETPRDRFGSSDERPRSDYHFE